MELLEDVDEFLQKIENKYNSSNYDASGITDFQSQLCILSEEFNTFGLPSVDLQHPESKILEQITNNTLLLIQIHRKTLLCMRNSDIDGKCKDTQKQCLEKTVLKLKTKIALVENQNKRLENAMNKLNDECLELKKMILTHNQATDKLKLFFKSKENELIHQINKLKNENNRLKEICSKDIEKYYSRDEKFLKVIQKYKQNEEVYKNSLQKLENNNEEIMNEILNLRAELALAYSSKE